MWPGLITKNIKKHMQDTEEIHLGHMKQKLSKLQTTKPYTTIKTKWDTYMKRLDALSKIFLDIIGRFPKQSSKGNQYVFIGFDADNNYIQVIPIKG